LGAPLELEAFCHQEYGRLIGMLTLYCGDAELARDLAQEAMARACAHWRSVREMHAPRAWLSKVAMNLANSHWRRRAAEKRSRERMDAGEGTVHMDVDVATALAVRAAVAALPKRQRAALILRYFEDLSVEQTAGVLRCEPRTVKKLTTRAFATLRCNAPADWWEASDVS